MTRSCLPFGHANNGDGEHLLGRHNLCYFTSIDVIIAELTIDICYLELPFTLNIYRITVAN